MTEKELLKQLNSLKFVQADAIWRQANRQQLATQIAQGKTVFNLGFFAKLNIGASRLFQPYAVAIMIVLFFTASGLFSYAASRQAKPGDSLYLAKRLSERTKMLVAFDEKSKTKLNLEFAGNRAKEIAMLMGEDNGDTDNLKSDFKNEISQLKGRLAKFNIKTKAEAGAKDDAFQTAATDNNGKNIDIAVPKKAGNNSAASSSQAIGEVLEEAEQLFNNKSYDAAADKLDQVNELIDEQVK